VAARRLTPFIAPSGGLDYAWGMRFPKPFIALILATPDSSSATHPVGSLGGEPYGAIGTEPFWGLSVTEGRLAFDVSGWPQYTYSVPAPAREATARGYRYRTPRLVADMWREDCNDGMTDRMFADSVVVTMDGRRFEGCGGPILPPETLAGTGWGFAAIAGVRIGDEDHSWSLNFAPETRLTPEDDFAPNTYRLYTPCGEYSGPYSRTGDALRFGPARTVARSCSSRERVTEARLRLVLRGPTRISFQPDGTFVLSNAGGVLRLTR